MSLVLDPSQEVKLKEVNAELKCFFEQIATIERRIEDLLKLKDELIIDVVEAKKKLQEILCQT